MPSKSKAQHNAMEAAAHGKSTLGIPKKVGRDFAAADKGKKYDAASMAKAIGKRRKQPQQDPEAEAQARGGYSPGNGGVGSG